MFEAFRDIVCVFNESTIRIQDFLDDWTLFEEAEFSRSCWTLLLLCIDVGMCA